MNALMRFGRTCVSTVIAGAVMAGGLLAGSLNPVKVTLPHAVTVGSTTLPTGDYTITTVSMSDGEQYFVVRGEKGPIATLPAMRIDASEQESSKTSVIFTQDGDQWKFDRLFIQGEDTGYQFVNSK